MTESEYKALTGVLRLLIAEVRKSHSECADTRDRIEHLIERVRELEVKISALAAQLANQREDVIEALGHMLDIDNSKGGPRGGTDGTD